MAKTTEKHDKNKLINVKQIAENLTSLFKSSQS